MDGLYAIRAAGGRHWLIVAVLSGYEDQRYVQTGESRGGFSFLAENKGQAGGMTYGAGTMAVVCLGRSFQPLICCRVRIQRAWPTGGITCQSTECLYSLSLCFTENP